MLAARRALVTPKGSSGYVLDQISASATGAYSMRLLRAEYDGRAINVRRDSDNTILDVGFTAGVLDTASLLSFVGAANGYVAVWYDQSGNGNDLTQGTDGQQMQIIDAGSLLHELNGTPCMGMATAASYVSMENSEMSVFESGPSTANLVTVYGDESDYPPVIGGGQPGCLAYGYNGSSTLGIFCVGSSSDSFGYSATNDPAIYSFLTAGIEEGSATATLYANGANEGTATGSSYGGQPGGVLFGSPYGDTLASYFAELTLFPSELSDDDRQTLETNQGAFYDITVA